MDRKEMDELGLITFTEMEYDNSGESRILATGIYK